MTETLQPALPDELDEQAERLMRRVCELGLSVATAESCTGGLLASLLTDINGAGHGFDRGFVVYDSAAKVELLGLTPGQVDQNKAVTAEVARAMAEGTLNRCKADIALAVTGFAGPGAEEDEEGLVFLGCARRGHDAVVRKETFGAIGRGGVRIEALRVGLEMLEDAIAR